MSCEDESHVCIVLYTMDHMRYKCNRVIFITTVSDGAITGIVLLCLVVVACVPVIVFLLYKRRRTREPTDEHHVCEWRKLNNAICNSSMSSQLWLLCA